MSAQNLLLKIKGLYSFPSHLSEVPSGALLKARNIVINRDSIAESRRGFKIYGSSQMTTSAHQLLDYKGRILRHYGTGSGQYLDFDSDGLGTFVNFSVTLTASIGAGSPVVTAITDLTSTNPGTSILSPGMFVSGSGILPGTTILSITDYNDLVLSQNATLTIATPLTFTYDIKEVDAGLRIKGIEQNGNFYFTTSEGIKKISVNSPTGLSSSRISLSGGVKALDVTPTINSFSGSAVSPNSTVAYRVVWGIKDANDNLILGAPSGRTVINNTSSSIADIDLKITIPKAITPAYFYQIYRTASFSYISSFTIIGNTHNTSFVIDGIADTSNLVAGMGISGTFIPVGATISSVASATSIVISAAATGDSTAETITLTQVLTNTDPGDEEGLVYEANPTVAELQQGYLIATDSTPDSLRGANLYTNANSGEGILQANEPPPLAKDITSFKGYTFFSNTNTLQNFNLTLLSTSLLTAGTSTFTISDGTTTNTYIFNSAVQNGDTTFNNNIITNLTDTSTLNSGLSLRGSGIPSNSVITQILSPTSISISNPCTATANNVPITFAVENSTSKLVALSQLVTPSQQITETSQSLVRMINSQFNEIVYAYYLSGPSDLPGKILLQARKLNQAPFYLTVNSATTTGLEFSPNLPTSGQSVISTNDNSPNRIYYSKVQQPEAVPIVNFIDVGPKDKQIIRILALRDSLFILKEEGVYRLSGLVAPFTIYPFDFSTNIKASDSAVVLNNLIYMYSNQGITTVSDTGIAIISRPIENQIIPLFSSQYSNFNTATFGVSYESDRAYYIFTVTNTSDVYATQCFRFNTFTNTWTQLILAKRSGIVNNADDLLYLSPTDVDYIEQERKIYDRTDYADREIALTISPNSVSGTTTKLSSIANVSVSDVLVQVQTITIKKFNQLLSKLDKDSLLADTNYTSLLSSVAGDTLSSKLDALIAKIRDDAGRTGTTGATSSAAYTALIGTGSSSFTALQTEFNSLINILNLDPGLAYHNYQLCTTTTSYEFPIIAVNASDVSVTSTYAYPLIVGPVTVYNHIDTDLQFVPQYFTDVSITKQVSEGTAIFEDASFTNGILSYATDLSANFEPTIISGAGNGIFGNSIFGDGVFGGVGSGVPFRTYVPKDKQRCRYMNVDFKHTVAREIFSLYGISLSYTPMSSRGWR